MIARLGAEVEVVNRAVILSNRADWGGVHASGATLIGAFPPATLPLKFERKGDPGARDKHTTANYGATLGSRRQRLSRMGCGTHRRERSGPQQLVRR